MNDLFATQGSLFGAGPDRIPDSASDRRDYAPDPADIRRRLHAMLAEVRAAERMPWEPRKAGVNAVIFPQMADWLPNEEADQLRFAFAAEMERLKAAA